jgi:hypothetical protein
VGHVVGATGHDDSSDSGHGELAADRRPPSSPQKTNFERPRLRRKANQESRDSNRKGIRGQQPGRRERPRTFASGVRLEDPAKKTSLSPESPKWAWGREYGCCPRTANWGTATGKR